MVRAIIIIVFLLAANIADAFSPALVGTSTSKIGLKEHPSNPRYFQENGAGGLKYLVGREDSGNVRDIGTGDPPAAFDWDSFLTTAISKKWTLVRLWAWDMPNYDCGGGVRYVEPFPWARASMPCTPNCADDDKGRFDFNTFNQTYFDRLRTRVTQLNQNGIIAGVMLFEGFGPNLCQRDTNDGFPFISGNNSNSVSVTDQHDPYTTTNETILNIQKAYIRKTIDTLNDLDVIWEIANEAKADSVTWQDGMADYIRAYEASKPTRHPIWFTYPHPDTNNNNVWNFDADVKSPGEYESYDTAPPVNDKGYPVILDTDHLGNDQVVDWFWKAFLRGHNIAWLYPYGTTDNQDAMKWIATYAAAIPLKDMTPTTTICSTQYCMSQAGVHYLAYQPGTAAFTVDLSVTPAQAYTVEWFDTEVDSAGINYGYVHGGSSTQSFTPPTNANVLNLAAATLSASCSGYTICQGFEGTGYDNSETWAETAGGACNSWLEQTAQNGNWVVTSANRVSQKISNAASRDICKVQLLVSTTATSSTVKVELWSNEAKTGTKYGESGNVAVTETDAGGVWKDFTITLTSQPAGDFFLHVVHVSGDNLNWKRTTDVNAYVDTNYDLWVMDAGEPGTDRNRDAAFKILLLSAGTIDEDYTTTPIMTSQSLRTVVGAGGTVSVRSPVFTAMSPCYAFTSFKVVTAPSTISLISAFRDASDNWLGGAEYWLSDGKLHAWNGGSYDSGGTCAVAVGTIHYVWVEYTKGTGANGVTSIYLSSTTKKPASACSAISTGTATADVRYVTLYSQNAAETIHDYVRVKTTAIGDTP